MSITVTIEGNDNIIIKTMALLKAIPGLRIQSKKNVVLANDMLIPNSETMKAIREAETSERCNVYKNSSEMFKNLGINV